MHHWELPQDAHNTKTYNLCMTKQAYFTYTSTHSSSRHNTNRKYNIHYTPSLHKHRTYFNTPRRNTIFNNGRYTTNFPQMKMIWVSLFTDYPSMYNHKAILLQEEVKCPCYHQSVNIWSSLKMKSDLIKTTQVCLTSPTHSQMNAMDISYL